MRFDKVHYKNSVLFIMINDFECIMKDNEHILVA